MICLICRQANVYEGLTSVSLQRGEIHLVINNVPGHICRNCGEAYMDEDVTVQLLRIAQELSQEGTLTGACEYIHVKK